MNKLLFRLNHTLTSAVLFFTIYVFGAFPQYFHILHTLKVAIYFLVRFYSFKKKKFHYYMFDFCYCANIFASYVAFYEPTNITLQKMLFVVANGPLALAVILLSNKLVYHSNDYVISSYIHTSPMLLSYIYRWNILHTNDTISFTDYCFAIFLGIQVYVFWLIPYCVIMYLILYYRTMEKNNMTMFDYVVNNQFTFIKNISSYRRIQQFLYTIIHFVIFCIALCIAPVLWYYQPLHFMYIVCVVLFAIWNGSSYYYYKIYEENKEHTD